MPNSSETKIPLSVRVEALLDRANVTSKDPDFLLGWQVEKLEREVERLRYGAAQHQGSLTDQLKELYAVANRAGLYDAADWLQRRIDG